MTRIGELISSRVRPARRRCFSVLDLDTITSRYRGLPKCARKSSGCGVVGEFQEDENEELLHLSSDWIGSSVSYREVG